MSEFSNYLEAKLDELVTANRILGRENVCDAFGHVSIRHPDRDDRYFLSRSRAPERIEVDDLMEFTLDGDPIDQKGDLPTRNGSSMVRFTRNGLMSIQWFITTV